MNIVEDELGRVSEKDDSLSTLKLWQIHIRRLGRASSKNTHRLEVSDASEKSNSIIVLNMPGSPHGS